MSSSTQIDAGITDPAPENREFIDRIARAVSIEGPMLERRFKACNENNAEFSFLWSSDSCHAFYQRRLAEYLAQNQDGAQDIQPDSPATHECVADAPPDLESPPSCFSPIRPFTDPSFEFPAETMTPHEFGIIKLTALFLARWGPYFWVALTKRVDKNPQFEFLRSTGSKFKFVRGLAGAYSEILSHSEKTSMATVLKVFFSKVEMSTVDLHAFVGGVDCFTYMDNEDYSANMPPPERLSMIVDRLEYMRPPLVSHTPFSGRYPLGGISFGTRASWRGLMELGIINLTVARYGPYFCRELKKEVDKKPQFEFMKPTDSMYNYYSGRVGAYSKVFTDLARLSKRDASTAATVINVFFQRLQLEKLEEKADMAMDDLYAFLAGVDCFDDMEDEEYSASLPPHVRQTVLLRRFQLGKRQPPLGSQLTEYRAEDQDGVQDIHECDVQPVLAPIWDPPLTRSSLVMGDHKREIPLKELGIIKLTAQFVARYGPYFCRDLMKTVDKKPQFKFMKPNDSMFEVYSGLAGAYSTVLRRSKKLRNSDAPTATVLDGFFHHLQLDMLEEGVDMAIDDLHAYVGGVDCFAYMENEEYSTNFPPPERLSVMMNRLRQMQPGILNFTLKELAIIKLTAQFVARYGHHFSLALKKRVDKNPQLEFMKLTDSRSYIWFNVLVKAYSRVLRTSDQVSDDAYTAETVIEVFFQRLQLEKLEEGVEMAMIDLHAFVCGVDCFVYMEEDKEYSAYFPPPEHLSVMMNRLTQMQPGPLELASLQVHPRPSDQLSRPFMGIPMPEMSPPPLPEEPEPKRQKFRAQHLGSSTTRVSVDEQTNRS